MIFKDKFFRNKNVFVTGHTGFKGSWLCIMLNYLGSKVTGYSLKPKEKSLFQIANLEKKIKKNYFNDIRDFSSLKFALTQSNPDIIIHMAAQSLVLDSYKNTNYTYETNIMGTVNILEVIKNYTKLKVKSIIVVTTDKVYNTNKKKIFTENDLLGANDPYSTSKVCCEYICESYIKSFSKFRKILSTARAGNVIGGGDFSKNRIVPDIINSYKKKKFVNLRNPNHIRPWQHVLEPLFGYLLLAKKIYKKEIKNSKSCWNFAPDKKNFKSVKFLALKFSKKIPVQIKISSKKSRVKENSYLKLSNNKSKKYLGWRPIWSIDTTINKIIEWENYSKIGLTFRVCYNQVVNYLNNMKT